MKRSLVIKAVVCVVIMEVLGGLGAFVTAGSVDTWYASLERPPGTPPNWVFGPVWSLLYALIGISFAIVLDRVTGDGIRFSCYLAFGIQLILNLAWTPIFFGAHLLLVALIVIGALLVSIVVMISQFRKVSKVAAILLIPYLLWVSYATYLNAGYLVLN